jgi:hypothetical protein
MITILLGIGMAAFVGCESSESPTESAIDPFLNGIWYSSNYSIGFEVLTDGSSKTLTVDTAGRLQYNLSGEINSSLMLTISKAKDGNLTGILRYKQPGIDTTMTIPGTYVLSNNNNTLSVTIPNPLSSSQQITIVFIRSAIGEIVKPKS